MACQDASCLGWHEPHLAEPTQSRGDASAAAHAPRQIASNTATVHVHVHVHVDVHDDVDLDDDMVR